jgi:hypothetical protein
MKPFLQPRFQQQLVQRAFHARPVLFASLLTAALMWIELMYRVMTSAVVFHADLIHIIWINATMAFVFVTMLGFVPRVYHKVLTMMLLGLFMTGFYFYAPFTASHIQFANLNFINSWAFVDLYRIRYAAYFNAGLLVVTVPLLWALFPMRVRRSAKQTIQLGMWTVLIGLIGFSYLTNPVYANQSEQVTNWEMLIYQDRPVVSRSRVGVNQATLQQLIGQPLFVRPSEQNVLGEVSAYLLENNSIRNVSSYSFRNQNVIVFQIEGLRYDALNPIVMPFLSQELYPSSVRFNNYYADQKEINNYGVNFPLLTGLPLQQQTNNTIDAFSSNNYPFALPELFSTNRYSTVAFHQFYSSSEATLIDRTGFDTKFDYFSFERAVENDYQLIQESLPLLLDQQRFFAYYHLNNPHASRTTPLVEGVIKGASNSSQALYFSEMHLIDQGIEYAVNRLRERGKLSNTVIMIVGMNPRMDELSITADFRLSQYRTPFFIYGRGADQTVNEVMGPVDVIPTLMSYFAFKPENNYLGVSAFAPGQNVVHFRDGSWISRAGSYDALSQRFHVSDPLYQTDFLPGYVDLTTRRVLERQRIASIILERDYFAQEVV